MSAAYSMEDEVDINSPVVMDDISDQEVNEVLDPASRVPFTIKKASIRTQHENPQDSSTTWTFRRLVIDAAIGDAGVDGDGKYTNKHLFSELLLQFNAGDFPERFASDWWKKQSRGGTKQFFVALGFDAAALPAINTDFLAELVGRDFIADIKKREIEKKTDETDAKGKAIYKGTGEYRNELANFRVAV